MKVVEIVIKGEPKEIAVLILQLQERQQPQYEFKWGQNPENPELRSIFGATLHPMQTE